jgi:hypothetical protein
MGLPDVGCTRCCSLLHEYLYHHHHPPPPLLLHVWLHDFNGLSTSVASILRVWKKKKKEKIKSSTVAASTTPSNHVRDRLALAMCDYKPTCSLWGSVEEAEALLCLCPRT